MTEQIVGIIVNGVVTIFAVGAGSYFGIKRSLNGLHKILTDVDTRTERMDKDIGIIKDRDRRMGV